MLMVNLAYFLSVHYNILNNRILDAIYFFKVYSNNTLKTKVLTYICYFYYFDF